MRLRMVEYDAVLLDINMPGIGRKHACGFAETIHTFPSSC